jgi:hypothetical protein
MRNRFMVFIVFMAVLVVAPFVSADPTLGPKEQCYQFNAEPGNNCDNGPEHKNKFSTWLIVYKSAKCKVEVRAIYDSTQPTCVDARNAPVLGTEVNGQPYGTEKDLKDIARFDNANIGNSGKAKKLRNVFTDNGGNNCNEIWLRFADDNGCNARCFTSGGRAYCY